MSLTPFDLHEQAIDHFNRGEYGEAGELWQAAILRRNPCGIDGENAPISHYWYLGLALLLQGEEAEAQLVWMTPLLDAEPDQSELWIAELTEILDSEADRQAAAAIETASETAWTIRQHLHELNPAHLPNLLQLLLLELEINEGSIAEETLEQASQTLSALNSDVLKSDDALASLLQVVQQLLEFEPDHPAVLRFIEACIPHVQPGDLVKVLMARIEALFFASQLKAASTLGKICLRLAPNDLKLLALVIPILQSRDSEVWLSIRLAEQFLAQAATLSEKILACQHLLSGLMSVVGQWNRATTAYELYKSLVKEAIEAQQGTTGTRSETIELGSMLRNLTAGSVCFYFEDQPSVNRPIRNQIASIAGAEMIAHLGKPAYVYPPRTTSLLKVGYLSKSLRRHSIGWLIRWLLKHHNPDRVEVHLYSTRSTGDSLQQSFMNDFGDRFHALPEAIPEIADQIYEDHIDILVELDSLTWFGGCAITSLKPAPIQVNWLGFDASGLPAIDYFIADPYVLPDNAQTYYSERIWRLPHTYIAVDGFEVEPPSLRRDQLDIPDGAIVYLSSQTGLKRNPANVRLQMQILRAVPNSYFLIKSLKSDPASLQAFFYELAAESGVSSDRLRFLPDVESEAVHRGNLRIADVVLDTFPYTGATTTLETLWMGIPLVTRVGEQFAARNSYAMLINVGVTEGIAATDEEYIEWGIRMGSDEALRQKVSWQLNRSRHTSPLWNARQFAQDLETAYEQMWEKYRG